MQSATYFHFSILGINPFCVQTGNVSHIFAWKVVSIHTVPAPRAHAAAAPRKVTSALPSLAARWAGGRGAWGNSTPSRKYWLQYMRQTGNMVTLEDNVDCGGLGVVTRCCCRNNLKMLINDKKVINQSHGQRAHPSNPSKIVLFVYQITDLEMFHFSLPTIQSPLINKYFRDYKYSNCL